MHVSKGVQFGLLAQHMLRTHHQPTLHVPYRSRSPEKRWCQHERQSGNKVCVSTRKAAVTRFGDLPEARVVLVLALMLGGDRVRSHVHAQQCFKRNHRRICKQQEGKRNPLVSGSKGGGGGTWHDTSTAASPERGGKALTQAAAGKVCRGIAPNSISVAS